MRSSRSTRGQADGVDAKTLEAAGFSVGRPDGQASDGGADKREEMEAQRRAMVASICTVEARDRLARVALVKPDTARAAENHLIGLARAGRLREQVSEGALIKILEALAGGSSGGGATKVRVQRKKRADEDDDDDDGDF